MIRGSPWYYRRKAIASWSEDEDPSHHTREDQVDVKYVSTSCRLFNNSLMFCLKNCEGIISRICILNGFNLLLVVVSDPSRTLSAISSEQPGGFLGWSFSTDWLYKLCTMCSASRKILTETYLVRLTELLRLDRTETYHTPEISCSII